MTANGPLNYQSLFFASVTTSPQQDVFVIPDGYSVLKFLQFNPGQSVRIDLRSQKSKVNLIDGLSLNQVNHPFLPLNYGMSVDDRFVLSVYTFSGTVANVVISAAFQ